MQLFVQTCNFNIGKRIGKLDAIIHSFGSKLFRVHLRDALDVKWSFIVLNFATTDRFAELLRLLDEKWMALHSLFRRACVSRRELLP